MEKLVLIGNVLILLLNILVTHFLLSRVKSIKYCTLVLLITNAFIIIFEYIAFVTIENFLMFKIIYYLLAFLVIVYINLVFAESLSKKIFTMFSVWMFSNIIIFVCTFTIKSIFGQNYEYSDAIVILLRLCVHVALLPIIYFYCRKPYKAMLNIIQDKIVNVLSFYPIMGFIVLVVNYNYNSVYFIDSETLFGVVIFLLLLILGYIMVIMAILSVSKNAKLQLEYRIVENQVEFQRENYKTLSEAIQNIYSLRHDTRHHFSLIKTMIEEKKFEKATEYIRQFDQHETNKTIPTLCENFTADSITKYYMSIALNKNIEFRTNLMIPEEININNLDLCIVLGNCLENSIDACDRIIDGKRKYINFQSKVLGSNLVFKIVNSFNGEVERLNHSFKSTKEKRGHGIGIENVHKTVNKYEGILDIKYTNEEFEVDIVMNTKCNES